MGKEGGREGGREGGGEEEMMIVRRSLLSGVNCKKISLLVDADADEKG